MRANVLAELFFALTMMVSFTCWGEGRALTSSSVVIPRTQVFELSHPLNQRVYPLWVKLPSSYQRNTSKRYPVIYVTDAPYAFQIVSGVTRFPMNSNKMQEAIIVGLSYAKADKGPQSRVRDYTPVKDDGWKLETGGADAYADYIEQVVFPFMAKHYRVQQDNRTFVGNSLGGLLGAYLLLSRPALFDNYLLGSPSVWYHKEVLLSMPAQHYQAQRRVFIAVGEFETPDKSGMQHDMVVGAAKLTRHLEVAVGKKLTINTVKINGAYHETAFASTASQGLYWLYRTQPVTSE